MTDSSTGGYLAPLDPGAPEGDDLDDLIQPVVVGITGLPGNLVVIKGQPVPPQQPDRSITWCAIGVTEIVADINASVTHDGCDAMGQGTSTYSRTEAITLLASFYGPQARALAVRLRDGLAIGQNRAALRAQGLAFVAVERLTGLADLDNQQFIRRCDAVVRLRRTVSSRFAIRNVAALQGVLVIDAQSKSGPATLADSLAPGT